MDQLNRDRRRHRRINVAAARFTREQNKQRTQPFPASDNTVRHRLPKQAGASVTKLKRGLQAELDTSQRSAGRCSFSSQ